MDIAAFNRELFNEIIIRDFYNLRDLPKNEFDLIIDLGGNIGMFTQYAKTMFPKAHAITVEADARVHGHLMARASGMDGVEVVPSPIGTGSISYQHNRDHLNQGATIFGLEATDGARAVESKTLKQILGSRSMANALVKIDIEGSEQILFSHPETVAILRQAKRIVAETHWGPSFVKARAGWNSFTSCDKEIRAAFGDVFEIQNINRHPRKDPRIEDGSGVLIMARKGDQTGTWVEGCARCGRNHFVNFRKFSRPNPTYSAWGLCPTNGEPVLQRQG